MRDLFPPLVFALLCLVSGVIFSPIALLPLVYPFVAVLLWFLRAKVAWFAGYSVKDIALHFLGFYFLFFVLVYVLIALVTALQYPR